MKHLCEEIPTELVHGATLGQTSALSCSLGVVDSVSSPSDETKDRGLVCYRRGGVRTLKYPRQQEEVAKKKKPTSFLWNSLAVSCW